jgi:CRP-like cAMP-binding protein
MRKALFFLGILSDEDVDWMIATGSRRQVPAGAVLIREGSPIDKIYVVLDGSLRVMAGAAAGRVIATLFSGEVVGEMSFVDSRPPSATVIALEESLLLELPREPLSLRLNEPEFAARFYHALAVFLADRLRTTVGQLGYGPALPVDDADDDIDPAVLDHVAISGARFDWMLKRLRGY